MSGGTELIGGFKELPDLGKIEPNGLAEALAQYMMLGWKFELSVGGFGTYIAIATIELPEERFAELVTALRRRGMENHPELKPRLGGDIEDIESSQLIFMEPVGESFFDPIEALLACANRLRGYFFVPSKGPSEGPSDF